MVEIKIDTSRSSKDDIRRAIAFLKNYLDEPLANKDAEQDLDVPMGAMNIFEQQEPDENSRDKQDENNSSADLEIKPIFY